MSLNIGFISTRFSGTDGVSLESAKWAEILWESGHVSHWYAGELDRNPGFSMLVPEAFFGHEENEWINKRIWGQTQRDPEVSQRIHKLAGYLKSTIYEYVEKFSIDILIPENALTIPMHLPLGIAITEFLAETQMPCIAHHHDFSWERIRFSINAVTDYLEFAFPPRLPNIIHTVINQAAQEQLCWRRGVTSILTPNVIDFKNPPPPIDDYAMDVRENLGLAEDDIFILQPTRIVPRKGIEHAIKLVEMLDDPKCKLVISHSAGDEGFEYVNMLHELAHESNVDLRIVADQVDDLRGTTDQGEKIYTLWDLYPHADFVTYPSLYEGFGNALLEAIYFKKPVLINRYDIFARDIEPKGFHFPMMEGYVRRSLVKQVKELLEDKELRDSQCEHNYITAQKFFSYEVLRRKLNAIIANLIVE
ncbi:glycosyltransferase family 4 protein [Kiritimatiellaeota bacterium B1221]|nr:glycosyltransferase family 4 protein [Kiritimatiellaeota bacterium B1221]